MAHSNPSETPAEAPSAAAGPVSANETSAPAGISPGAWAIGLVIAALLAVAWREPLKWMYERWMLPDSYYSHGVLVPFVALYFIWRDRYELVAARGGRSMIGLAVFLFGLLLHMASGVLVIYFTGAFAIIPTIWGLCGYLFGIRVMKKLALPMFILVFMVPPPLEMIDRVSNNLKLFVAQMALGIFNLFGVTSVKDGATIYLGDAIVTVGNACSGLRSLISLLFLGVLFAAASGLSLWRRIVLFLASMPIAIISNLVRVLVLCLIAYLWGNEAINAKWGIGPLQTSAHDASGYLIFLVAFALLYGTLKLLSRGQDQKAEAPQNKIVHEKSIPSKPDGNRRANVLRFASVFALLAGTAAASATVLYERGMEKAPLRTPGVPLFVAGWVGSDMPLGKDVTDILETDDVIQRNYRHPLHKSRPVQLAVVFSPKNRRVAHPPEICYTNVGWELAEQGIEHYADLPDMVRLRMHHSRRQDIVIYCFLAGQEFTANYYRQQYNIARNTLTGRPTSSALVRMSTTVYEDESQKEGEDRLLAFARSIMPELETHLK